MAAPTPCPRGLTLWWLAVRPRTLTLAAMPVLCGSALAWHGGAPIAWPVFFTTLACAALIQAGTNLYNDAADGERGNDGPARLGPPRVTAAGLASAGQVRRAASLAFATAFVGGVYLVFEGGWPILVIGLASLAAGWAYSGGPRPLSHTAWGEVWVMAFFGLAAVAGSHFLQGGQPGVAPVLLGLALGAPAPLRPARAGALPPAGGPGARPRRAAPPVAGPSGPAGLRLAGASFPGPPRRTRDEPATGRNRPGPVAAGHPPDPGAPRLRRSLGAAQGRALSCVSDPP